MSRRGAEYLPIPHLHTWCFPREVEVLRRLQAGLLTDNLSPTERLAQMDDATYDALVSVLVPATAASQRRLKLEYFGRLSHAIGSA